MRINIGITTHHRVEKLVKLLQSFGQQNITIPEWEMIQIQLVYSDELDIVELTNRSKHYVPDSVFLKMQFVRLTEPFRAPRVWNSMLWINQYDVFVYLTDDVELDANFLHNLMLKMKLYFPDYDGVLGFNQVNLAGRVNTCAAAFGAIGRTFADRFPNREVFCPEYGHLWIDNELEQYALSVNKFKWCRNIQLNHYHPAIDAEYRDRTHDTVRMLHSDRDAETHRLRAAKGLIWGDSFEKVRGME